MKTLIRLPEVMSRTGLTRTTLYELIRSGKFPDPIPITKRTVAWDSEEISSWITDKVKTRKGK